MGNCNVTDTNIGVTTRNEGYCVTTYMDQLVVEESRPRALAVLPNGQVFGLERGGAFNEWETLTGYVVAYNKQTHADSATGQQLIAWQGLTHGLAVDENYIYASTATTVYRWAYSFDDETGTNEDGSVARTITVADPDNPEVVISGIPSNSSQELHTRSLLLNGNTTMYVSVGAEADVEPTLRTDRAVIKEFSLEESLPLAWNSGTVIATGLRNAAGMAFHPDIEDVLWALDSAADNVQREDLGDGIGEDNPADELNMIELGGGASSPTYGYPFCWSEYQLPSGVSEGPGSQWAWHDEDIFPTPVTDAFCRNDDVNATSGAANIPPAVVFPGHSVPLGITFYEYREERPFHCGDWVSFPEHYHGHAFVAYHGSYFRDGPWIPGRVVRIPITVNGTERIVGDPVVLLEDINETLSGIRPVDVKFDDCGRLLITSDGRTRDLEGRMILRVDNTGQGENGSGSLGVNPVGSTTWYLLVLLLSYLVVRK